MDKILQRKRMAIWKKYQYDNKEALLEWATKKGIVGDEVMVLSEVFSRTLGMKALKEMGHHHFVQTPLTCHYDFDNDVRYECKFRTNDADEYPTDDLTEKKTDWDEVKNSPVPVLLLYMFWDGVVRCYDMSKPCGDGEWTHSKTTAKPGKEITEGKLSYCPDSALWTTTITLPDEFV